MQEPTHLKKRISGNVNSENTTQEIAQETSAKASKKTTSNERSRFYIFQKLIYIIIIIMINVFVEILSNC